MPERRGKRYTRQEREEILQLYRQSGYSAARFCREMALSAPTLKRWLGDSPGQPIRLVEVEAWEASSYPALVVRLPNGLACELGAACEVSVAVRWIRELMRC